MDLMDHSECTAALTRSAKPAGEAPSLFTKSLKAGTVCKHGLKALHAFSKSTE